jgi:hypothetical protein
MNASFILACVLGGSLAGGAALSLYLKLERDRLRHYGKWARVYSLEARQLFAMAEEIPEPILDALSFWNSALTDKRFAKLLAKTLVRRKQQLVRGQERKSHDDQKEKAFFESKPEAADKLLDVVVSALMAISYSHLFWGIVIRSTIMDVFAGKRSAKIERFSQAVQREVDVRNHKADKAVPCPA